MDAPMPENDTESTKEKLPRESHLRSMLKAASWRLLATLTTVLIAYMMIGDVNVAMKIGAVEVVAKMLIYYFHERAWAQVPLGTIRKLIPSGSK